MIIKYTEEDRDKIENALCDEDHTIEHKNYVDYLIKAREDYQRLKEGDYLLIKEKGKFVIPKEVYESFYCL